MELKQKQGAVKRDSYGTFEADYTTTITVSYDPSIPLFYLIDDDGSTLDKIEESDMEADHPAIYKRFRAAKAGKKKAGKKKAGKKKAGKKKATKKKAPNSFASMTKAEAQAHAQRYAVKKPKKSSTAALRAYMREKFGV